MIRHIQDWGEAFTSGPLLTKVKVLLKESAGIEKSASVDDREEKLAEELYQAAVLHGGWVLDLGIWGPAAFRGQAAQILALAESRAGSTTAADNSERLQGQRDGRDK